MSTFYHAYILVKRHLRYPPDRWHAQRGLRGAKLLIRWAIEPLTPTHNPWYSSLHATDEPNPTHQTWEKHTKIVTPRRHHFRP